MKYDYNTALNIAYRGFEKMTAQVSEGKYTITVTGPGKFEILKATGEKYEVCIFEYPGDSNEYFGTCSCPFCNYRDENLTCKHILFCKDLIDWHILNGITDYQTAINEAQAKVQEDAYYDTMEAEWEESQAYQRLTADINRRYPARTHEREDVVFDAII